MTSAVLFGASSGALHAVTGPDHVLSLGPLVLDRQQAPWRIGLRWGVGHAIGTLLLALPLMGFTHTLHLPWLAAIGDRLAGLALMLTAGWSFYRVRRHSIGVVRAGARAAEAAAVSAQNALLVGVVHWLTGAASLMLLVPMLAAGAQLSSLVFLVAFALGSTLGMALLTSLIAKLGSRLQPRVIDRSRGCSAWRRACSGCAGSS